MNDDAGGDDACDVWAEDTGRHKGQFVCLSIADDSVSGVVAPKITDNDLMLVCQKVDKFALGFIAPLQSYYGSRRHNWYPHKELETFETHGTEVIWPTRRAARRGMDRGLRACVGKATG